MKNPLKHLSRSGSTSRGTQKRAGGAVASLAAIALVAGCGTAAASGSSSSSASASSTSSSSDAWTTITSEVASASTGATVSDITSANADTSDATGASTDEENSGSWDTSSATTITLDGDSVEVSGSDADSVTVDGTTVTITGGGTFVVSGTLDDGELVVNASDADVHVVLKGASITNADGAAVDVQDAGSAVVVLADGSKNTLTDGTSYSDTSDDAPKAALYSHDDLTITGTGELTVTGNSNDGISSKNGLVIQGDTTIKVTAADDGIVGKDYLLVSGGTITVDAQGDGLKSSEDNDETKGFVQLGKAKITITVGDDGVQATTDVTVDGTTLDVTAGGGQANASTDQQGPRGQGGGQAPSDGGQGGGQAPSDGGQGGPGGQGGQPPSDGQAPGSEDSSSSSDSSNSSGSSNSGVLSDSSSSDSSSSSSSSDDTSKPKGIDAGVSYTQDSGTVTFDVADEGIQSAFINVNGGTLDIASGDDGINATNSDYTIEGYENADSESDDGAYLTITGGEVQIDNASSDGIDSNGSVKISGGEIAISGTYGSPDGSVDVNGDLSAVGANVSSSVADGDTITVTSSDGSSWELSSAISDSSYTILGLTSGTTYTVESTSGGSTSVTAAEVTVTGGGMGGQGGPGQQSQSGSSSSDSSTSSSTDSSSDSSTSSSDRNS